MVLLVVDDNVRDYSHTCNGARERIFDHFLSRNSLATTPIHTIALDQPQHPISYGVTPPGQTRGRKGNKKAKHTCQPRPNRIPYFVDEHTGIVIKFDRRPVFAL